MECIYFVFWVEGCLYALRDVHSPRVLSDEFFHLLDKPSTPGRSSELRRIISITMQVRNRRSALVRHPQVALKHQNRRHSINLNLIHKYIHAQELYIVGKNNRSFVNLADSQTLPLYSTGEQTTSH